MSKLDHALYEIHHMDTLADKGQWLNRIHPLVKLIVTVSYIAVTVSPACCGWASIRPRFLFWEISHLPTR